MPSRIICAYEDVIQVEAMCLRYLFSRLGQSIVAPQKLSGGQFQAQCNILTVIKESRKLLLAAFMFALPIFTVRATIVLPSASVQWTLAGRKKPRLLSRGYVFALPIFTASHPATIVGVHELNFCVRDGNRWTLMTINTNSFGWDITHHL